MSEQEVVHGDCLDILKQIDDCSIDAVVTDPPAGIEFMGKAWDRFDEREPNASGPQTEEWDASGGADGTRPFARRPTPRYQGKNKSSLLPFQDFICEVFTEVYRVLKPGGHALVWALPRTSHHTAMGLERAGFEIRDRVSHLFGSGFPKSLNLDGGLGTALKPACEDWWLARKPLDGTVAENVLKYGTGALNIDACRVSTSDNLNGGAYSGGVRPVSAMGCEGEVGGKSSVFEAGTVRLKPEDFKQPFGRWPANLLLTCCGEQPHVEGCAVATLDVQSGVLKSGDGNTRRKRHETVAMAGSLGEPRGVEEVSYGDSGGASRFFAMFQPEIDVPFLYQAKPSRKEREAGCEQLPAKSGAEAVDRKEGTAALNSPRTGAGRTASKVSNHHPTVKAIGLMRYLIRLITPPGGIVLDPFAGSGSTLCAAALEGVNCIGIEREQEYVRIVEARLAHWRGVK